MMKEEFLKTVSSSSLDDETKEELSPKPNRVLNLFSKKTTVEKVTFLELHRKEVICLQIDG